MCGQNIPITCSSPELKGSGEGDAAAAVPASGAVVSVAVPVYNNADSLRMLHARLVSTLRSMESAYEIIYVNDGSTDASYDVLTSLRSGWGRVKILDLTRNFGQSAAILAAISEAVGDIIVTIDADLQNHPEDVPALVGEVRKGADLACGIRRDRRDSLLARRGPSWLANRLVGAALGIDLKDWGCGLNAVTSVLAREILAQDPLPAMPKVEAALMASCIAQVPIQHSEREHGQSGYNNWRLCRFSVGFLQRFSIRRSFSRLFGAATGRGSPTFAGFTDGWGSRARRGFSPMAALSWAVLAGAAAIVQVGAIFCRSAVTNDSCRIREILE
jgi:hypothetical protein